MEDRAEIAHLEKIGTPDETQMHVEVSGTPIVAVKVVNPAELRSVQNGYVPAVEWMTRLIKVIREDLFTRLETYAGER